MNDLDEQIKNANGNEDVSKIINVGLDAETNKGAVYDMVYFLRQLVNHPKLEELKMDFLEALK